MSLTGGRKEEYWYFRFTERFIFSSDIREMRRLPIVGYKYVVIFFELCAKAIENKGWIKVTKYSREQPYITAISEDIGEDSRDVADALSYFVNKSLVEVFTNEEYTALHIPSVENNTGRSSREADQRRLERNRKQELDKEDLLLSDSTDEKYKEYGKFKNILLTEEEYGEMIRNYGKDKTDVTIKRMSAIKHLCPDSYKYKSDYEACREYLMRKNS